MTRRLVAVGRVRAPYRTVHVQYAHSEPAWRWNPLASESDPEPDWDLYRKQLDEERMAGDDL